LRVEKSENLRGGTRHLSSKKMLPDQQRRQKHGKHGHNGGKSPQQRPFAPKISRRRLGRHFQGTFALSFTPGSPSLVNSTPAAH
jgi:hypothetical protein